MAVFPDDAAWREATIQHVQQWTAMPLFVPSPLVISSRLLPSLVELPPGAKPSLAAADWAIWVVFAAEYVTRLSLAVDHRRYAREHLLDGALLVLPMLRPLRAPRALRLLRCRRVPVPRGCAA